MHVFRHEGTGLTVGCNYKVMYSFMAGLESFSRVASSACDYMLTRNPYSRAISTFFGKLRKSVNPALVQHCQRELMLHFKLDDVGKLRRVRLAEFIDALPELRDKEDHFRAQTHNVSDCGRLIKIESDLGELQPLFPDVDFNNRVNAGSHLEAAHYLTPDLARTVAVAYQDDFAKLNYRTEL